MNILTIPLRNLRRKWPRTMLLLAVFTLGVTAVVSLFHVSTVVGENMERKLAAYGANILLSPQTESLTVSYGGFSLGNMHFDIRSLEAQTIVDHINNIALKERISVIAPKLVAMTNINDTAVGVIGVDWKPEQAIKNFWAVMGEYPQAASQLLAGSKAANVLGLQQGTVISLFGQEFTVSGILMETGSDDDNVLFVGIETLQILTKQLGKASFVEVAALCAGCPIDDIVAQIANGLPKVEVTALRNVVEQRMMSIMFVKRLILGVGLIILVTACAMVGLSMLSSVNERKKEIGMLRALGYSRGDIFSIFTWEAMLIGLLAGSMGYGAGYLLSNKALALLDMIEGVSIAFNPAHFAICSIAVALLAMIAATWPALKAAHVEPSQALISL